MPILIVSDIHGSHEGIRLVKAAAERLKPEMILSAGDQCPDPSDKAFFLSLTAVRGNCDRFYEYDDLPFPMQSLSIDAYGRTLVMTHGDMLSADDFMLSQGDIFVSGHTHIPHLEERNGIYFCNPGSPSRPRSSSGPTAALLDENGILLLSLLNFSTISSLSFSER